MTLLWWVAWAIVSLILGHSAHVAVEHANGWGATLVLCAGIDLMVAAWAKEER